MRKGTTTLLEENTGIPSPCVPQFHPSLLLYPTSSYGNSPYNLPRKLPHIFRSGDGHSFCGSFPHRSPQGVALGQGDPTNILSWHQELMGGRHECQLTSRRATFMVHLRSTFQTVVVPNHIHLPLEPPQSLSEVPSQQSHIHNSKIVFDHQKRHINTLSITSTSPCKSSPAPAVPLHGYGAGLGFLFKNLSAIDWLGMGKAARVPSS